jgi:hypothetical protein
LRSVKFSRAIPVLVLYLWWLVLSANYLLNFWSNPLVAGADGSGHVAVLDLYARHVYPSLHGWIPELFGGIPFPVYYPPLFYWTGATVMALTRIDATTCAKLLTTFSLAALPAALYLLARKVRLTKVEALIAAGAAGVVACGSNIVSLSGIGLLGLFEVGLFTQTLGFVFFCLWAAWLPRATRSRKQAVWAMVFLVAAISTNAHILPLIAIYSLTWFLMNFRWARRLHPSVPSSRQLWEMAWSLLLLAGPLLICGIWLVPLVKWYQYAAGQPLSSAGVFASLGSLNIVWPLCAYVAWRERNRRRHLSTLCVTLLIAAGIALTPLAGRLKYIPFQPARVLAGALLLCTIPVVQMTSRILAEMFVRKTVPYAILVICILALAWLHPIQQFGIGAFSSSDAEQIAQVCTAVKGLPPGKVLIEIVEPEAIFNSSENRTRELALSRALTHEIARDGRPILWSIFREQSLMAPYATAVTNLFSSSKETFGLNGIALQRSAEGSVNVANGLAAAKTLNVAYFLVRTTKAVDVLQSAGGLHLLWRINGWTLFTNLESSSPGIQMVPALPVFAWLPANSKSRSPEDVDLFNLGELLALEGFPHVLPLWARSEGVDVWEHISRLQSALLVIDPAWISANQIEALRKEAGKLKVVLLADDSGMAAQIRQMGPTFAAYAEVKVNQMSSRRDVLAALAREVSVQAGSSVPGNEMLHIWRTTHGYFPAWQTTEGQATFLTGQGDAAILSAALPSLRWHSLGVRLLSLFVCFSGLLVSFIYLRNLKKSNGAV